MKITVFGATGKTGGFVLDQALARGWDVTALTRSPEKLATYAGKVHIVAGTNSDEDAIRVALDGSDAVISAMGAGSNTLTDFGPLIVSALRQSRISRFVSLIGASIRLPGDPETFKMGLLRTVTQLIAADIVADGHRYSEIVTASPLDYTLVRPPRLTLAPPTSRTSSGATLNLSPMSSIGRASVGRFMVQAVADRSFVREAPMIVD